MPYVSIKISLYALSQDRNLLNRWCLKSLLFLDESGVLQRALKAAGRLVRGENPRAWYEGAAGAISRRKTFTNPPVSPQPADITYVYGSRLHRCTRHPLYCRLVYQLILNSSFPGNLPGVWLAAGSSAAAQGTVTAARAANAFGNPPRNGEMPRRGCALYSRRYWELRKVFPRSISFSFHIIASQSGA